MPKDFARGFTIAPHRHLRAQLIYAPAGAMRVSAAGSLWMVPPQRALWMPPGIEHSIRMLSDVTMRTLYLREDAALAMPRTCHVLPVSPLLRELIVRATELPLDYDEAGPAGHLVALLLSELHGLQSLPLDLPLPGDPRVMAVCRAILDEPGDRRGLADWARDACVSERTLARLFRSETGLSFGAWRQQARLLEAMGRLGAGEPVTRVALDLGYDSISAFSAMFRRATATSPRTFRSGSGGTGQSP